MFFALVPLLISLPRQDARSKYEIYLDHFAENHGFSGIALMAKDGIVQWQKAYGYVDEAQTQRPDLDTPFRVGSITKQFTALRILQLAEEKLLDLQGSIKQYLPNLPTAWSGITVHHLLTHSSGIVNTTAIFDEKGSHHSFDSTEELVAFAKAQPLEFEPGSKYNYSNTGYVLLGTIIEHLTQKSFEQNLFDHILQPIGMTNTGVRRNEIQRPAIAVGLYHGGQGLVPAKSIVSYSVIASAGGLYTSAADLIKWDQALYSGELLAQANIEKMFTPYQNDYGYGWKVLPKTIASRRFQLFRHDGMIDGYYAHIGRIPAEKLVVVILSNNQDSPVADIYNGLYQLYFSDEDADELYFSKYKNSYEKFAGQYQFDDGTLLLITPFARGLMLKVEGYPKLPLMATDAQQFSSNILPIKIRFLHNDIEQLLFTFGEEESIARRL